MTACLPRKLVLLGALLCASLWSAALHAAEKFPLKDGDTWVMVGDSITAQHLHSNYFEAFCFARYPGLTFRFRNSGVGGDTIPKVLARYDWDVAPWKPTVVSVELGMNDKGGFSVEQFMAGYGTLTEKIRSAGARPVYLTASPVNNGEISPKLAQNQRLHEYALALEKFAVAQQAPYADQFHALVDTWGKNKPRENLANAVGALDRVANDDNVAGVEHLRKFIAAQKAEPKQPVSLLGDPVHPGPTGQLMMAAALLKALGAESFVSSAKLSADGKTVDAKGCKIDNVENNDGKLAFDRLDETLPFPIADDARAVLDLDPTILELSQYTLQVEGLPADRYALRINGAPVASVSRNDLARGVNLTAFAQGPIAAQGKAVLAAVGAKESVVGAWRAASKVASEPNASAGGKEKLAELANQAGDADAKIRLAAKPQKLRFELTAEK